MRRVTGRDHLRWPPDRFYWAVLDAAVLARREQRRDDRLGYLFEDVLPVPLEEVQVIYRHLGPDRWLACGAACAAIAEQVDPDIVTLTPETLPSFIDADLSPGRLNLLVGEHEPRRVRQWRRRILAQAIALLALALLMFGLGVERRVGLMRHEAARLHLRRQALIDTAVGSAAGSPQPPELRLLAEHRRLVRTRLEVAPSHEPVDVAVALAQLLAAWPRGPEAGPSAAEWTWRLESVVVDGDRIVVRSRVPDTAMAERLSDLLREMPGWRMAAPTFSASDEGVTVVLRLTPAGEGAA